MVFAMTVMAMPAPKVGATDFAAGDLIKSSASSAVYYYDGTELLVFPHEKMYFTYYEDWSGVQVVSADDLAGLPFNGKHVTVRPGTYLIKVPDFASVYAVEPGGVLRHVADEATAVTLWGDAWASIVIDVGSSFFSAYNNTNAMDNPVIATAHPTGSLIRYTGSDDIYYIDDAGQKRLVTEDGFTANFFNEDYVVEGVADSITYTDGTSITVAEADLFPIAEVSVVVPPVTGEATIALSASNPASGTVVKSAARYPMLKVDITAGADANASVKLRVQRTGLSVNTDFASVAFLDGNVLIGNTKTFNSNNECLSDAIAVTAGTTKTITVAGNIRSDGTNTSAGTAIFSVTEVVSSDSITTSLPIVGNQMTLSNAVTIGTATAVRGSYDPNSTATKEIGTIAYTFISYKLTASTEDQQVEYIRFTNQGSIADTDLENVKLYIDNEYYTDGTLVGDYVNFDFTANPVAINKGAHKEFSLVADIIGGSGRTIDFDVDKTTDVAVKGLTFHYYITPSAALDAGNIVAVSAGTLTISKSNSVGVGNIAEGQDEVALGAWVFKAQGEGVEISQSIFTLDLTVTGSAVYTDLTNCAVYDASGTVLTGAVDAAANTSPDGKVTFSDTISLPVGDNILTLKCNLSTDFANGDTIVASTDTATAASFVVKGTVTGDNIAEAPVSDIAANVQTIKAGSIATYTASTPVAQSLVKGTVQAHFATFILDATGSGEDVKVTQIKIADTPVTAKAYDLSNVKLYIGTTPVSVIGNFDETTASTVDYLTYNLSGNDELIVPKGTTVLVHIMADISASATTGNHVISLSTITCQGKSTGTTISSTPAGAGQAMTLADQGTLTTSLDSSNPDASLIAAGSTGVTLTVLKMEATYEDIELDTIMLTTDVTTAASSTANDYVKLYLYDEDGNKIVETTPTSTATYTITVPDYVESNGNWVSGFKVANEDTNGAKLYVKADFSLIGTGLPGTSGAQAGWKVAAAGDIVATGKESGQGATESGTTDSNTHWVYKSVPTVAMVDLPTTILGNGTKTISKFSVTADAKGDIDLKKFSFTVATTSCTLGDSTIILYDVTGSDTAMNSAVSSGASGLVEIVFTNPRTIPAGTTKTFELRGTISGAGTAGDTISTELMGDILPVASQAYPTTYALVHADSNNDFIWSDMSASSHAVGTYDWTNGYLVNGLQSTTNAAQIVAN